MAEGHLASAFKKDHCVICKLNFENEEPVHVTKKGMLTLDKPWHRNERDSVTQMISELN